MAFIKSINKKLADCGSDKRLIASGRNGYEAIDEISVDANGVRIGSGVNRNVQCGSSRECSDAAWDFLHAEQRRADQLKVEFANAVLRLLSVGCNLDHIYREAKRRGLFSLDP